MGNPVDVVLIRPQEHDYDYLQWHEDLSLGHVLRELTAAGISCSVYDFALRPLLSPQDYAGAVAAVAEAEPRLIVVVIDKHPTNSPHYAGRFISALRGCRSLRETHLTIYGNTQVGTSRLLAEFPVDSVVVGEEHDARLLAQAVLAGSSLREVPGVAFIDNQDSTFIENPPLPNRQGFAHSLPPQRYFFDIPEQERNPYGYVAAIEASRGCYAKCTFCYIRTKERVYGDYSWIGRKPEAVVAEMCELYRVHGVREFSFVDPQFFGPGERGQKWAQELALRIIESEMSGISYTLYARANDMHRETLELLKKSGLYAVFIGIESFSSSVLKRYRKGVTVERNLAAITLLMDLDIRLRMGFVSFDHYTTLAELEESVVFLQGLLAGKPHLITQPVFFQNILAPLDDTPIGDEYRNAGASAMAVDQPADRLLLARRQERLTRGGPITAFADPKVSLISELTRVLASEITQRTTRLEISCGEFIAQQNDFVGLDGHRLAPQSVLAWLNQLTSFAIEEFARLVHSVRSDSRTMEDLGSDLAREIGSRMSAFDRQHLGCEISPQHEAAHKVID